MEETIRNRKMGSQIREKKGFFLPFEFFQAIREVIL